MIRSAVAGSRVTTVHPCGLRRPRRIGRRRPDQGVRGAPGARCPGGLRPDASVGEDLGGMSPRDERFAQLLLASYEQLTRRTLVPEGSSPGQVADWLYEAPF